MNLLNLDWYLIQRETALALTTVQQNSSDKVGKG